MTATTYDVLVIGAGIVGSACAFRLADRGLRVGVLEAQAAPAMGSTGKSAAGIRVQFSSETNIRLSWESLKEFRDFQQLYGADSGYRPVGYLFIVPESNWQGHIGAVDLQRRVGVPVEVLTPGEAQRFVAFNTEGVHSATYGPVDGTLDPHGICLTYLRLARERGATVHVETELLAATRSGAVWRVETSSGAFEAPEMVNAAGAWSGVVGQRAGLDVPVSPHRRIIFMSGPLKEPHDYPLTIDLGGGFYFRSEGERLLMGRSNLAETPGFKDAIDWEWLEPTMRAGMARFPWVEHVPLDRRASWAGYYEITPDNNPVLGRPVGVDGWLNACGFSGHGVQQSAAVGRVIAEELVEGRATFIDIDEFRIERFASGGGAQERHIV